MSEVGDLLTRARGARSMYAVERAGRAHHATLHRIERGLVLPQARTIAALANYYGADTAVLIAALARDRFRIDWRTVFGIEPGPDAMVLLAPRGEE